MTGAAGQKRVPSDFVAEFPVFVPPIDQQDAIAAFLDRETTRIDALIAGKRRLIELLHEKRQAVISHAVTKGLDPNAPMKDSGVEWLGEIPAHWQSSRLKFECSAVVDCLHTTSEHLEEGEFPSVRTADLDRGRLFLDSAKRVSEEVYRERIARLEPIEDDVLYSREGERYGHAASVPPKTKLCLGQRMMMLRIKRPNLSRYWMWLLNAEYCYQQAKQDTYGATSPHLNISDLVNLAVCVPPPEEQAEIASELDAHTNDIDRAVDQVQSAISKVSEHRAAMISAAVTGKIDVYGRAVKTSEAAD